MSRIPPKFLVIITTCLMIGAAGFVGVRLSHAQARPAIAPFTTTPPIVSPPGGFEGVEFIWAGNNYYQAQWTVRPNVEQSGSDGYYYVYSLNLLGGSTLYAGLQVDNHGKRAIFSIWDALDARGSGTAKPFDGEGTGYQTLIDYPWQAGGSYRFQLSRMFSDASGSWWQTTVTNVVTGSTSTIGQIEVPASWGGLSNITQSWTEHYSGPSSCTNEHYSSVNYTSVTLDGLQPLGHQSYLANRCPGSRITEVPGGVRQEVSVGNMVVVRQKQS